MTSTTKPTVTVRRATRADGADVARIVHRAFFEDPVMRWITPDSAHREEIGPVAFGLYAETYIPLGDTYVTTAGTGATLWAPPGVPVVAEEDAEAFAEKVQALLGDEEAERLFELDALFEAHAPTTPRYHCQLLATLRDHQGEGIGSALLREVLDRCDREGLPAYLEATTLRSRALYERHGFVFTGTTMAPTAGPTMWAMWRDPASAGS